MRDLHVVEVNTVSGGNVFDGAGKYFGGWVGYNAASKLCSYDVKGFDVGGAAASVAGAVFGAMIGDLTERAYTRYVDPILDRVIGA